MGSEKFELITEKLRYFPNKEVFEFGINKTDPICEKVVSLFL
jgi:hypothetical protein